MTQPPHVPSLPGEVTSSTVRRLVALVGAAGLLLGACDTKSSTLVGPGNPGSPGVPMVPISGVLRLDLNSDGTVQDDEPAVADVFVVLFESPPGGADLLLEIAKTDGLGEFQFVVTSTGTYRIEIGPLPDGLVPTSCAGGMPVNGSCGSVTVDIDSIDPPPPPVRLDFGLGGTASIGGFAWVDENCNGVEDAGEIDRVKGVPVTLSQVEGSVVTQLEVSATSDLDGSYTFTDLFVGEYLVEVSQRQCHIPSPCDDDLGSAPDSSCNPATVVLEESDLEDDDVDFGFCPGGTGSISGFVWNDLDRDGHQDPGEPGLPGVRVRLEDASGTLVERSWSDAEGNYVFGWLCAGTYFVRTLQDPCLAPTVCTSGSGSDTDSNCSPAMVVLATDSSVDSSIDFGFLIQGDAGIGDRVWLDGNENGVQDPGESGIPGALVALETLDGIQLAEPQTTSPDGEYYFSKLCAGTYVVVVDVDPFDPTLEQTECMAGGDPAKDSDCSPATVVLAMGEQDMTVDFGYRAGRGGGGKGSSDDSDSSGEDATSFSSAWWSANLAAWPAPYTQATRFADVFPDAFPGATLSDILQPGRGPLDPLASQAVAGLLNAASGELDYPLTVGEVIALFERALHTGDATEWQRLSLLLRNLNEPPGSAR